MLPQGIRVIRPITRMPYRGLQCKVRLIWTDAGCILMIRMNTRYPMIPIITIVLAVPVFSCHPWTLIAPTRYTIVRELGPVHMRTILDVIASGTASGSVTEGNTRLGECAKAKHLPPMDRHRLLGRVLVR